MKTMLWTGLMAMAILAGTVNAGYGNQNDTQNQGQAINTPPVIATLTPVETAHILHMRQEEKLARDVYLTLAGLHDHPAFTNIAQAEQRHMDAVGLLVAKYGLTDPIVDDTVGVFSDEEFGALYTEFTDLGAKSLLDALNVGAEIERIDINDLKLALKETDKGDIQWVLGRLLRGSMNHLRAFTANVAAGGNACTPQSCPRLSDGNGNVNGPAGQGWGQGQGWCGGRGDRGPGNGTGLGCGRRNGACIGTGTGTPQQNQDGTGQNDQLQMRDGTCQTEPSA